MRVGGGSVVSDSDCSASVASIISHMTLSEFQEFVNSSPDKVVMISLTGVPEEDPIEYISYASAVICNGGFNGFYLNCGFDAKTLMEQLALVELVNMADIVRRSLAMFPDGIQPFRTEYDPSDSWSRVISLVGGKRVFHDLEQEFFAVSDDEFERDLANHIRKNAADYYVYYVR
jgi:hypothetical protein